MSVLLAILGFWMALPTGLCEVVGQDFFPGF